MQHNRNKREIGQFVETIQEHALAFFMLTTNFQKSLDIINYVAYMQRQRSGF